MGPPGPVTQSVASPTADPGIASSIQARIHTFVEIDYEIIAVAILPFSLFQELQAKICARSQACPRKKMN